MWTNFTVNASVFFALVFVCAACSAGMMEKWTENRQRSMLLKCKKPHLKNIRAQELIGDMIKPFEIISPHSTAIHRCADDTGCCGYVESTCTAKRSKDIELVFRIYNPVLRVERYETYVGKSDLECWCQKITNGIK